MSRRGNCWDNAPMENFFGHLKEEYLRQFNNPPLRKHNNSLTNTFTFTTMKGPRRYRLIGTAACLTAMPTNDQAKTNRYALSRRVIVISTPTTVATMSMITAQTSGAMPKPFQLTKYSQLGHVGYGGDADPAEVSAEGDIHTPFFRGTDRRPPHI